MKVLAIYAAIIGGIFLLLSWVKPWEAVNLGGGVMNAQVAAVHDGDTMLLSGAGTVRLIGIDTPEVPPRKAECGGAAATRYLKRIAPVGSRVKYEEGEEKRDKYGRTLIYLRNKRGSVNRLMLAKGHARRLRIKPNLRFARAFDRAERRAKRKRLGLWGRC